MLGMFVVIIILIPFVPISMIWDFPEYTDDSFRMLFPLVIMSVIGMMSIFGIMIIDDGILFYFRMKRRKDYNQ